MPLLQGQCTDDTKAAFHALAQRHGLTESALLRQIVAAVLSDEKVKSSGPELRDEERPSLPLRGGRLLTQPFGHASMRAWRLRRWFGRQQKGPPKQPRMLKKLGAMSGVLNLQRQRPRTVSTLVGLDFVHNKVNESDEHPEKHARVCGQVKCTL